MSPAACHICHITKIANHFVCSRQGILVDSHVKLWAQALEWVLLQLQTADHIRMTLQQSFCAVYWNEVNPVLASLGQIIQNCNYPISNVLDAVNHVCQDLLEVFHQGFGWLWNQNLVIG